MKPPSTEDPPPPPAPAPEPEPTPEPPSRLPPFGRKPDKMGGMSKPEIAMLVAIAAVLALKALLDIDAETWSALLDWAWRTGTPEAIQPGIDVITGVRRQP
jgi:hypothetical protein